MNIIALNKSLFTVLSLLLLGLSEQVYADEEDVVNEECGQAEIRYHDSPELTRAERIALMEKAFFDSLNRFESCQLSNPSSSSSENANGTAQSAGGNQNGNAGNPSTASQDMQGTEPESQDSTPPEIVGADDEDAIDGQSAVPTTAANNGAVPEDIPSANNDDAIASQIRLAAEAEQDPEIKKKLWNEYRKYKGMDIVED